MPQPPINVNINLPNLPSLPSVPGVPSLPSFPGGGVRQPAPAVRGGTRPTAPAETGPKLNRSTKGTPGWVANLPDRPDPVGELRFKVHLDIDGKIVGRFRECSGLAAEIEVKDYNEGGVNHFVHKLPTRMKYPNLVLKRGVTYEEALLQWLWTVQRKPKRVAVTVSLMGPEGAPVREWSFAEAFPIKWTGPTLNASSNQVATETLEIVHGGLQLKVLV